MTEAKEKELQQQAAEAERRFYAMAKRFDETGFFTAEDEEIAKQSPPPAQPAPGE